MQQFYTLEEAAKVLGMTTDALKKMADKNEVRAFRDRGTMRFRAPEIEELARRRGRGSDPEAQLGEVATPPPSAPAAPAKGPAKTGGAPEVFEFSLTGDDSDQVEIGQEMRRDAGSSKSAASKSAASKSSRSKVAKSPPPKPGSDSDVRLVADGSVLDFQIASDSDVKLPDQPPPVPAATPPTKRKTGSSKTRGDSSARLGPAKPQSDSSVRLVDASDSDVSLGDLGPKEPSDSDVRLESPSPRPTQSAAPQEVDDMRTEEVDIDLDSELQRAEQAERQKPKGRKGKGKPAAPQLPTTSPFELSEADLEVPAPGAVEESSDFDLTPAGDDSSPVESSSEIPLQGEDDEVSLGELTASADKSGISLHEPADSGISLEQGGSSEEIEFELSLDEGRTPKPTPPAPKEEADSDSEFELSLDEEPAPGADAADSDSEFELSLEPGGSPEEEGSSELEADSSPADSDSEFELSLDDSGGLAVGGEGTDQAAEGEEEGEKDIFETDFEVPSLEDESGSQAVALEDSGTDLESSSDFDLALGDEDIASEEESGSQVVALEDEGEVDESAETVARPGGRRRAAAVEAEEGGEEEVEDLFDVGEEGEAEEEEEEAVGRRPAALGAAAAPAEWGILPVLVMLPCVVVMFFVGLMSYELVRRDGLNNPNMVTKAIASMFTELPKD